MTLRPSLRRMLLSAAAFAALAVAAPAAAQTFEVSANVARACTVEATNVAVAYDPVTANFTTDATNTGNVSVRCTRGTSYTVYLDDGDNYSGGRRMQLGATGEHLDYELYSDALHTTAWNTTTGVTRVSSSRAAFVHPVYVVVPAGQDPLEGTYVDTVVATINF